MAYNEKKTAQTLEAAFDLIAGGGKKATKRVAEAVASAIAQAFADAEVTVTVRLTDPVTMTETEQTAKGTIK